MKKLFICASVLALCSLGTARAQDIYKVEQLAATDLDGDARFVGMGGAMGALGANISAMSTNPASTGLYRRSDISLTAGINNAAYGGVLQVGPEKTQFSFDQAGLVYSCDLHNYRGVKFINMGFNYKRSRNLKSYIGLDGIATKNGLSQSWQLADMTTHNNGNWLDLGFDDDRMRTSPIAFMAYDTYFIDAVDDNGVSVGDRDVAIAGYIPSYARGYDYHRAQWGGVEDYDFNISMNINERVYLGFTMGVYNVDMHSATLYKENLYLEDPNDPDDSGDYEYYTKQSLTGYGFDGKFGILVRPIDEHPFRLGLSITTPTLYNLESRNYAEMISPYVDGKGNCYTANIELNNSYHIRTPWKLDVSAATTFGTRVALDAEYQYQCQSSAATRYYRDYQYFYRSDGWETDRVVQQDIDRYLKDVHTFRVGAEVRIIDQLSARLGYNFISAPFDKDAYLSQINAESYRDYNTANPSHYNFAFNSDRVNLNTDYVNLGATHRITAGLGYRHKAFYMDFAFLHQRQNADVYAFHHYGGVAEVNRDVRDDTSKFLGDKNDLPAQSYILKRNQAMLTLGFKF